MRQLNSLTRLKPSNPMLPEPYRIGNISQDTKDTFTLELQVGPEAKQTAKRTAFQPGQFNMLYIFGVGEVPISISGDPQDNRVLVHTTREVGTVTRAMRTLNKGDMVGVRGPFGSAWPVDLAKTNDLVLIAGGIGLAPLRPVLYHALANRDAYGRVILLYGTRTPEDILFKEELAAWHSELDLDVLVSVDQATGDWHGNVGFVTQLIKHTAFDPEKTTAMICGPEVMMRFSAQELQKLGVKSPNIYVSMERNMKCAVGFCGHCQYGPHFVCKDGPVFTFSEIARLLSLWEV